MRRCLLLAVCCLVITHQRVDAQAGSPLPVMPLPAHVEREQGQFLIDGKFTIGLEGYTEPRLERAESRFLAVLARETGIPLRPRSQSAHPQFVVRTTGPGKPVQQLGEDESYRLEVTPDHVLLTAPNPLGALHGLQTFLQMVTVTPQGFGVAAAVIDDHPRFPWRGLMIDSSRHFIPIPDLERTLDGMEAVKLNVFHWHLSDDQGFRAQSLRYPLLQEKGADGLFYTQDQIRDLIQYARDRGIRVVPEFDMPCHTQSWFVGYPQLASGPGPYHVAEHVGVHSAAMDPTKDATYKFIDTLIGEMTSLFPDAYFHIGGDECNGKEWNANPDIQRFMQAHHLSSNAELQAWFTARVQKIVARHHKTMEGWDEVLQPGTPKDVVIQSWRGQASLAQAARQGNRGILSTGYYIDLNQPASEHYLVDPLSGDAASLDPQQQARILGGEATMWTEFVTPENLDSRIWPRTAAIAERLWSPAEVNNVPSMYARLAGVSLKLAARDIDPRAQTTVMLERMSGEDDPSALRLFASALQPPLGYHRSHNGFTTQTPLNRLVDAIPPESVAARRFHGLVAKIVAGQATPQQWQQAREMLIRWRDNDARLQPVLQRSFLLQELVPVAAGLHQVAMIGLEALDNLQSHRKASPQHQQQDLQSLKSAQPLTANLRDMVAPSVELLLQSATQQK